jgi:hypothetical protein
LELPETSLFEAITASGRPQNAKTREQSKGTLYVLYFPSKKTYILNMPNFNLALSPSLPISKHETTSTYILPPISHQNQQNTQNNQNTQNPQNPKNKKNPQNHQNPKNTQNSPNQQNTPNQISNPKTHLSEETFLILSLNPSLPPELHSSFKNLLSEHSNLYIFKKPAQTQTQGLLSDVKNAFGNAGHAIKQGMKTTSNLIVGGVDSAVSFVREKCIPKREQELVVNPYVKNGVSIAKDVSGGVLSFSQVMVSLFFEIEEVMFFFL